MERKTRSTRGDQRTNQSMVLVVDDVAMNRALMGEAIAGAGYTVVEAVNGQDALEKVRQLHPVLVLVDIETRVMSSVTAVQQLRQDPDFSGLPVIAVTTLTSAKDRNLSLGGGFNVYISKPCALKDLIHVVAEVFKGNTDASQDGNGCEMNPSKTPTQPWCQDRLGGDAAAVTFATTLNTVLVQPRPVRDDRTAAGVCAGGCLGSQHSSEEEER